MKAFALETDQFQVLVMEDSQRVRVKLMPKDTTLVFAITLLKDGMENNLLFSAFPVGQVLEVAWRACEPFEQVSLDKRG